MTFTIHGILELRLEDWNHQNVLDHLAVGLVEGGWEIAMRGCYGLDGRILARELAVTVDAWQKDL